MRTSSSKSSFWAVAVLLSSAAALATACGSSGDDSRNNATGGSGNATSSAGNGTTTGGSGTAVGGTTGIAGTTGTAGSSAMTCDPSQTCCPTATCKCPYPQGDGTTDVIDNMEDGMSKFKTASLMTAAGYWDLSKGADMGTVLGLTGAATDTTTIAPVDGGANGTMKSMHFMGSNLTAWGAALAAELANGCPFDASKYGGITFYAKGTSTVFEGTNKLLVLVGNPEYIPTENGGFCNDTAVPADPACYARHRVTISLTADWTKYTINWSDLQPPSYYTTGHAFGPDRIRDIVFNASGPSDVTGMPPGTPATFDVYVDELAFVPMGTPSNLGPADTGSGGSSSGGTGGTGGASGGTGGAAAGTGGSN
ncbi:MAG TPA: hypothetical protein VHV51_17800 [Polyangiaceae bacterium]|nr:hypothetical protein [Polyangiaceae bacterium]